MAIMPSTPLMGDIVVPCLQVPHHLQPPPTAPGQSRSSVRHETITWMHMSIPIAGGRKLK